MRTIDSIIQCNHSIQSINPIIQSFNAITQSNHSIQSFKHSPATIARVKAKIAASRKLRAELQLAEQLYQELEAEQQGCSLDEDSAQCGSSLKRDRSESTSNAEAALRTALGAAQATCPEYADADIDRHATEALGPPLITIHNYRDYPPPKLGVSPVADAVWYRQLTKRDWDGDGRDPRLYANARLLYNRMSKRAKTYEDMHDKENDLSAAKTSKRSRSAPPASRIGERRCNMCAGCLLENCGTCVSCSYMREFRGDGSLKHACELRICVNLGLRSDRKKKTKGSVAQVASAAQYAAQ